MFNKKYKDLEKRIEDLENRTFKEKAEKVDDYFSPSIFSFYGSPTPKSLEEEIEELQEKLDALAKTSGVEVVKTSAKDSKWVTKKIKSSKK